MANKQLHCYVLFLSLFVFHGSQLLCFHDVSFGNHYFKLIVHFGIVVHLLSIS